MAFRGEKNIFFWLADSNDHNFLSFWSRQKFLVSRIISCSRSLHFCDRMLIFGSVGAPYHADVIQPKGGFLLAKMFEFFFKIFVLTFQWKSSKNPPFGCITSALGPSAAWYGALKFRKSKIYRKNEEISSRR